MSPRSCDIFFVTILADEKAHLLNLARWKNLLDGHACFWGIMNRFNKGFSRLFRTSSSVSGRETSGYQGGGHA
jgi:hypothetical protein